MKILFTVSEKGIRGNCLRLLRKVGGVNGVTMRQGCINELMKWLSPFSTSWQMQEVSNGKVLRNKKKAAKDVVGKQDQCRVICYAIWQEVCQIFLCRIFRQTSKKIAFSGGENTLDAKRLPSIQGRKIYNK